MGPKLDKLHIVPETYFAEPNTSEVLWHISASGWLLGLAINPLQYAELKCNIQDYQANDIPNTEFIVGYGYTSGGIWFKEPLQNFNTALTYRLKVTKFIPSSPPIPNFTLYPIGCWDR